MGGRLLETDTLSEQNISSALAVGAHTATGTRFVVVRMLVDQVAGNGDYVAYMTVQVNGAGSSYRIIPLTTANAASGVTAIGFVSGLVPVDSGDIITVYIRGLAGDTTTPDTRVDFYELEALSPTTADRKLDVSTGGEAGVDWGNIGTPSAANSLTGTTVGTTTNLTTNNDKTGYELSTAGVKAIWDQLVSALTTANTIGKRLVDYITGNTFERLGTPGPGGTVSADIALVKADTAAILVDTGTSGVKLGDASITGTVFDQSTAFPLRYLDSGATSVARTGADGDTLETLSDQLDALAATSEVSIITRVSGNTVAVDTHSTWLFTISSAQFPDLTSYDELVFVVKQPPRKVTLDSDAILVVSSSAGLTIIGSEPAVDTSGEGGVLLVDSATQFTVRVDMLHTGISQFGNFVWHLKVFDSGYTPVRGEEIATGKFIVNPGGVLAQAATNVGVPVGKVERPLVGYGALGTYEVLTQTTLYPAGWPNSNGVYWYLPGTGGVPIASPNLIVLLPGYYATSPTPYYGFIDHCVRKGAAVIMPTYSVTGDIFADKYQEIRDGIDLAITTAGASIDNTNILVVGHSFGGGAVPSMTIWMRDQGWGGASCSMIMISPWYTLEVSQAEIEAMDWPLLVIAGDEDLNNDERIGIRVYNWATGIADADKDYVRLISDRYSTQPQIANHTWPLATILNMDGLDFYGSLRLTTALADLVWNGTAGARYVALGHGHANQTNMGEWPDGEPVNELISEYDRPTPPYDEDVYVNKDSDPVNPFAGEPWE